MTISKMQNGTTVILSLEGRLDTTTAPMLETEVKTSTEGISELVLDFEKLEYISSAGLRVLLATHKTMSGHGTMKIKNACNDIKEVFDITGFSDFLTVE